MKKIVLLMDHTSAGVHHPAGSEIEVSDNEYDFIMKVYMDQRKVQVEKEVKAKDFLKKLGKV